MAGSFANNDLEHIDPTGADHESFSYGLKKSLLNFMHGACIDFPLQKWFDFKVPKTSIAPDHIRKALTEEEYSGSNPNSKIVFIGNMPEMHMVTKSKKGQQWEMAEISFQNKRGTYNIRLQEEEGKWLMKILPLLSVDNPKHWTLQEVKTDYEANGLHDFELFWDNKPMNTMFKAGLLRL